MNSFGLDSSGGNPAGVVLDADSLSDIQKKMIAREVGFSETAFVQKSDKADLKVTFFTPIEEVDLCGHATIATYALLLEKNLLSPGEYLQELKAGILKININENGIIVMDQTLPKFKNEIDSIEIVDALQIPVEWVTSTNLIPQVVSTGLNDLLIPIKTREQLFSIKLNDERISRFQKQHGLDSFHMFTFDTIEKNLVANSRNSDPLHGIHEESATGSATGALACYLFDREKLSKYHLNKLLFEQGYSMGQHSQITVSLEVNGQKITRVQVGGKAVITGEKIINI